MDAQYLAFREKIAQAGFFKRDYLYYGLYAIACFSLSAASLFLVASTDNPLLQALNGALLGIVLVQAGMLGHDLSHQQVFKSERTNRFFATVVWGLLGGLSESKWFEKHSSHHRYTNQIGKDPDLEFPLVFSDKQRDLPLSPLTRLTLPYQHALFFPALPFIYFGQIANSVVHIFRSPTWKTYMELLLILVHFSVLFYLPLALLPLVPAALFLGANFLTIGLYMSLVFAPNHKGKELLGPTEVGTWREQITLTRNVLPGWFIFQCFGGLNFQIEHHLFPNIARTRYFSIRPLVKDFCREKSIPYVEMTWAESLREIYRALRTQARNAAPEPRRQLLS